MKRLTVLALISVTLACASVPVKQKAVTTLQANETALGQAQDIERRLCDPAKAALTPPVAITACTGPTAATIGLTDARHQQFARALSTAFDLQIKAGAALQSWKAGEPPPATLLELKADIDATLVVVRQLTTGANENVQILLGKIQAALDSVASTITLIQGAS